MKRFLSMLLCAAMLISLVPAAWAEEGADDAAVNLEGNQVELEPTDTFGNLVTNTLEDAAVEPDTSTSKSNSNIREVTIEGTNAYVTFFTETAAEIVVAIYSEDGFTMLGSGSTIVDADSDDAYVPIDIAEMPSYFLVGAYIMNPQSHEPLSEEYISREYTQEMQAFLSKTVADFDPERVLQLDGSPENNFAVYSEDTIVINEGNSDGVVVTDNGDGTYTIVNSTPELLSLYPGATIAYNHVDGTAIVIKVSAVSVIGTSVIVSEDTDAALEDVFDYVKIDTSSYDSELYIDNSDIDDCLTPISDPSQQMKFDDEKKVTGSYDINSSRDANIA